MKTHMVPVIVGLIMTGCATSRPTQSKPINVEVGKNVSPVTVKTVTCKLPVIIFIDASSSAKFKIPDAIQVCTKTQDVYWYAQGATKFDIKFRPDKTTSHKVATLKKYDADCEDDLDASGSILGVLCGLKKDAHIDGGDINYEFHAKAKNGDRIDHDPRLIIQP